MAFKNLIIILFGTLLFSCSGKKQVKFEDVKLTEVKKEIKAPLLTTPTELKVSAYLIFTDNTFSTFDVLNDKTITLWNTIIGEGDALKDSNKTLIKLTGNFDGLKVTVYNGKKKVINQNLSNVNGKWEFEIHDTGCEKVKVIVTKLDKVVYQGTIPFTCGE